MSLSVISDIARLARNDLAPNERGRRLWRPHRKKYLARSTDDVPVSSFSLRHERCGYAGALRVDYSVSANQPHTLSG